MNNYQLTIKISNSIVNGSVIPHAFVTISGPGLANPVTGGYYPQVTGVSGPGTVKNDAFTYKTEAGAYVEHPYDRYITFDISTSQAYDGLVFMARVANNPGSYQLLGATDQNNLIFPDGYQCTGFARDVAKAVGIDPMLFTGENGGIRAYPGWLGPEFSFLDSNQVNPGTTTPTTDDFNRVATSFYNGIKKYDNADRTPEAVRNAFAGGTAPIVNTTVVAPVDLGTPARDSASYFTNSGSHAVTVKEGGTLHPSPFTSFRLLPATILISNSRHSSGPLNSGVFFDGASRISLGNQINGVGDNFQSFSRFTEIL